MNLKPFALERYFAEYEFSAHYLLSSSDCDGLRRRDLLALADGEMRRAWDDRVIRDTNIMLLPSTVYGYDISHFRIGFGRENMGEAIGRLEEYLHAVGA